MTRYLTVKNNEEGNRNEGAEENSQISGEGNLKGEGHGGHGLCCRVRRCIVWYEKKRRSIKQKNMR